MKTDWPKELFVAVEEADGEEFYVADSDPKGLVATHDTRPVAKYVLAETGEIINTSSYTPLETH